MALLLIYELNPDRTSAYFFPNPSTELIGHASIAAGTMLNSTELTDQQEASHEFLSAFLATEAAKQCLVIDTTSGIGSASFSAMDSLTVVHTGFLL